MKKKLLALALAAAVTFSMTACSNGSTGSSKKDGSTETTAQTDADKAGTTEAAKTTEAEITADTTDTAAQTKADEDKADEDKATETNADTDAQTEADKADTAKADDLYFDELQHLVVAFPTWTGAPADTEMVVEKVNEILREKYNIEVEFQISDAGTFKQNMTLALSSGEQIDVINTMLANYTNMVNQGYLMDLEEDDLLQTYGQGILDVIEPKYIDACRVGDVLYGLTNTRDYAVGRGCIAVGTEYLDAIGYKAPADAGEIIHITEDELNDILAQLHEKFPDMEVYRPSANDLPQQTLVDQIGGNNFGVILGNSDELKIVNLFETDEYMDFCKRVYNWNQLGYISKDAAADTTAVTVLMKEGVLLSYGTGGKPGSKAQESMGDGRDMTIFQTREDYISSSAISSFPWCIPITTADPKASMVLLNEMYTNPELADLIIYGIEGIHYEINNDGYLDANAGTSPDTYATLPFIYPNQYASTVTVGNTADLWERTNTFNEEARKSPALGFTFDSTTVATELTAVTNVYEEYQKSLEYGFVDPETAIPEMLKKMDAAGLQKIIEEKQKQFDAWAAAK